MKKITPSLCFKACLLVTSLSFSSTYAQDIISRALPNMSAEHPAPTQVQSTDGGFFNNYDLEVIQEVNRERTDRGLNALQLFHYAGTNQTAVWTRHRADNNIPAAHPAADGPFGGITRGLPEDIRFAGEVANGANGDSPTEIPTAASIVRGYMLSEDHKDILLTPGVNVIVSASYTKIYPANGMLMLYNTIRVITVADLSDYDFAPAPFTIGDHKCTVLGTNRDDTIITDKAEHVVMAFAGNDTIKGASVVAGGRGHDNITGTFGDDKLYGQGGWDKIYGYAGDDKLYGGSGNDQIHGHRGNDRILGGSDDDLLYGQDGDDTIYGQAGNDKLVGQGGEDILYPGPSGYTNTAIQ